VGARPGSSRGAASAAARVAARPAARQRSAPPGPPDSHTPSPPPHRSGVDDDAAPEEIKRAYRSTCKEVGGPGVVAVGPLGEA
jgi:hypothetical protein